MRQELTLPNTQLPINVGSLERYIAMANSVPVLQADEEKKLFNRLHEDNDVDAARQLILAHLRFVVHIARTYNGYGLPIGDLIQEGNVGLMKAVKRFDPDHGVRLVSFAVHWIRAEIHEFVLRNWRIVKVATTKAQRKLFFNLRSGKKRLAWLNQQEAHAMAKDLGVEVSTVMEMESRLSGHDLSFDPLSQDNDDEKAYTPSAWLADGRGDAALQLERQDWQHQRHQQLTQALEQLDARSLDIVRRRWLDEESKPTLHQLAAEYSVSAERIRQLENNAMKKLQKFITV